MKEEHIIVQYVKRQNDESIRNNRKYCMWESTVTHYLIERGYLVVDAD